MKKIIEVLTGEVKAGDKDVILRSSAIGSCVVVSAYCLGKKIGALAHIMLPGKSPTDDFSEKTKYAQDAIGEILNRMAALGVNGSNLEICLAGGANVLKRPDDRTGKNNIDFVVAYLLKKNLKIKAKSLGGTERRSITFDIEGGSIFYTEGEGEERLLWSAEEKT